METIHVSFDDPTTTARVGAMLLSGQADAAAGLLAVEEQPKNEFNKVQEVAEENAGLSENNSNNNIRDEEKETTTMLLNKPTQNVTEEAQKNDDLVPKEESSPPFAMGDHVYQWCSFALIPAVFQHHAIVLDCQPSSHDDNDDGWILQIADFSNGTPTGDDDDNVNNSNSNSNDPDTKQNPKKSIITLGSSSASREKHKGLRIYESNTKKHCWHKVQYGAAGFWKRHLSRSGTCTAAQCDAPGLVRARVQFLLNHPDMLPTYHVTQANCECVAVWCKTGTWGTVQASSWLAVTAAGQAKSAATLAGVAASTQVTVPAAGLWGWLGYTTHVSLVSTQPLLLPAIAAYGIVTVGAPALVLARCKQQWKQRTVELNTAFWEAAVEHPEVFVECITHWSSLHEPSTEF